MTNRPFLSLPVLVLALASAGCSDISVGNHDDDNDGVSNDDDCDDTDADIGGEADLYEDQDGDGQGAGKGRYRCAADGWVESDADCDDANKAVNTSAIEICDGIDNNCDGSVDEGDAAPGTWYVDADGDGWGTDESTSACEQPEGYVDQTGDCDDSNPDVYPDAPELTDGNDNNCDPSDDVLPTEIETDNASGRIAGEKPSSGLDQACWTTDGFFNVATDTDIARFPLTPEGDVDASKATERWDLPTTVYGPDRVIACGHDVNGDGTPDVFVGSPGTAYVAAMWGESPTSPEVFYDEETSSLVGSSVAILEDLLVVGAPGGSGYFTLVLDEPVYGDTVSIGRIENLKTPGTTSTHALGQSLGAGDYTGDGVDDLAVGATGSVTIYDGAALTHENTRDARLVLTSDSASFGAQVAIVPDVTGDGIADLLAADPGAGLVYIVPGDSTYGTHPVTDAATATLAGEPGAGTALVGLEAVGGGGTAVAVGSPGESITYIIRAETIERGGELTLDPDAADSLIRGEADSACGTTLAAGDPDGDGVSGLIIGCPADDGGRGLVLVFLNLVK